MKNKLLAVGTFIFLSLVGTILPSAGVSAEDQNISFYEVFWKIMNPLISAIPVILGIIIGAAIPVIRDWCVSKKKRHENAYYSSIRLICKLEEYGELCVEVVRDNEENYFQDGFRVQPPNPISFPGDIIWKSLDQSLLYDILSLPIKAERINKDLLTRDIMNIGDYYPDRKERYIELGLSALNLAKKLRNRYKIQDDFISGNLNISSREQINFLETEKKNMGRL